MKEVAIGEAAQIAGREQDATIAWHHAGGYSIAIGVDARRIAVSGVGGVDHLNAVTKDCLRHLIRGCVQIDRKFDACHHITACPL